MALNDRMRNPAELIGPGLAMGMVLSLCAASALAQSDRRLTSVDMAAQDASAREKLLAEVAERARQLDEAAARTREEFHGCKASIPAERRVKRTSAPDYEYPASERRLGHEGRVTVCMEIGADGSLLRAGVIRSSHWDRLDEAALAAVRGWTFSPARDESGAATTDVTGVVLDFKLQTDAAAD